MLKKETQFWASLLFALDCSMIGGAWLACYWLRFRSGLVHAPDTGRELVQYATPLLLVPPVWGVLFRTLELYRPRRVASHAREAFEVVRASSLASIGLLSTAYLVFKLDVSRLFLVMFWLSSTLGLFAVRIGFREALRFARRRGFNVRRALVLGTDELARYVHRRLRLHPELGFRLEGYVTLDPAEVGELVDGVPVLGHVDELKALVQRHGIGQLFVSLSAPVEARLEGLLGGLGEELLNINLVSDLFRHAFLRGRVEEFEGMPVIAINESPMIGWNRVLKRGFDLVVGSVLLLLAAPLLALIALAVRLSSPGPVFYRQSRMGLDGRTFALMKFRTMRDGAEEETGAVWSQRDDPRCTAAGALLRRTSLDELPQLWNVVKGEMSLVGPRPERPVFVEEFKAHIPRYMLRHRVKAGLTGWAQVHGLRGATSIKERLRYDLFYIENWSLLLDLKILWRTLWGGFINKNA